MTAAPPGITGSPARAAAEDDRPDADADILAGSLPAPGLVGATTVRRAGGATRGRRQHALVRIRGRLPLRWRVGLGLGGVAAILGVWVLAASQLDGSSSFLVPSPVETWDALTEMWRDGTLWDDLVASVGRIAAGYSISLAIGVVVGVLIGSFASAESFFEPQFGFLRYIPAGALTPLLLLWLGIGESPKITLIVIGTVFFNILMVADVVRLVPRELLNAASTLGAGRWTTIRKVIVPHAVPGMIDVARINLAAAWLMLVVAELLASQQGLAYRIVRAQRFLRYDTMFALLIVFGVMGLVSDLALRGSRWLVKWARP